MAELDCRKAFTSTLLEQARKDRAIVAVTTDSRGSVTLTDFAAELPDQLVECGIAEQNAVGIAAGLANGGLRPFACGPACFYTLRSAEQVKVDVAYSHQNVKIVGVSGGVSYGPLGATHHSTHDVALLRAVPGIEIYLPCDARQTEALTRYLTCSDEPAYMRMGRGPVPAVYTKEEMPFEPGKANCLRAGKDVSIIACGEMVHHALCAAQILGERGIEAAVWDMFTLRPLDEEPILKAAKASLLVTVEEHSVNGGLGGAVSQLVSERQPTRMLILGLPEESPYTGSSAALFRHLGLDGEGIARKIEETLNR